MTTRTTEDQVKGRAFLNAFRSHPAAKKAVLLGYAGTGKTWLVGDWLEEVLNDPEQSENICVAAPTHKALDVLKQKCGHLPVVFKTLHSLLGLIVAKNEDGEIDKSMVEKDDIYTMLVVDEGSMCGREFVELIDANIKRFGKVLYVGDPAQLPPVKEDLSPIFKIDNSFTLTQVVRYDSAILNVATFLREQIKDQTGFSLVDLRDTADPADRSVSFISKAAMYSWSKVALDKELDCRILGWTNSAVISHNNAMHKLCYPDELMPFAVGEKVLVNDAYTLKKDQGSRQASENDPPDTLMNGELLTTVECSVAESTAGVVTYALRCTRSDGQELSLLFAPNEGHRAATHKSLNEAIFEIRDFRTDQAAAKKRQELMLLRRAVFRLAPLRHAYACTVHKSQGSTYDISMVDFSDVFRSDDKARLIYVAATRASKFLVFAK